MQFAGQRTDMDLKPVGEPLNVLVKLTEDILPDPDAVLLTGITPQQTLADGLSEAEFLKLFYEQVAAPDTIFVGFNSLRFDDEFMRYTHWRNFYDPYEWQWQDGRSRWDLLDALRMTRALRPGGIKWPFDSNGAPSNKLELISSVNELDHASAHDALSDVQATIAVAQLLRSRQPKLFDFLLNLRDKRKVAALVGGGQPFVYTSGKYPSEFEKTTVVSVVTDHPQPGSVLVWDLRHSPQEWQTKTPEQLAEAWKWKKDTDEPSLPVKTLKFNHCPAVAPLSVLDTASQKRLQLDMKTVKENAKLLAGAADLPAKLLKALSLLDKQRQTELLASDQDADAQLYDGFVDDYDRNLCRVVRAASADELSSLAPDFHDQRLINLLPLYKARNFPKTLSDEERSAWGTFRTRKLLAGGQQSRLAKFMARLQELAAGSNLTGQQQYILEELNLYAQSVMPEQET